MPARPAGHPWRRPVFATATLNFVNREEQVNRLSRAGRGLAQIWRTFERHLSSMQLLVSTVGGVIGIVIAYFAYQIDVSVQSRAWQEARINRAIALTDILNSDPAIRELALARGNIENAVIKHAAAIQAKAGGEQSFAHSMKRALVSELAAYPDKDKLKGWLYVFIQHVDRGANCTGLIHAANSDGNTDDALCDPETYLALNSSFLSDMFFIWRPLFACDDMLAAGNDHYNFFSHVQMAEGVPFDHVRRDGSRDEGMRFVEFGPEELCESYKPEAQLASVLF